MISLVRYRLEIDVPIWNVIAELKDRRAKADDGDDKTSIDYHAERDSKMFTAKSSALKSFNKLLFVAGTIARNFLALMYDEQSLERINFETSTTSQKHKNIA